ncbi:MAG: WYL domain-containing protein [Oscillospiraceae bacterium]|jgi:predicted DNA-binding transcriptional regulator YafY|nr:WYL domain-containing protein [Oscillospiraceae bacterium]
MTARRAPHRVKPVGIMFSEFYFYLITYMDGKDNPTVFRIDRIKSYASTDEHFHVPYARRFSEAEFRKRVQFMFAGDLRRVKFVYRGALEAALDRLPTAEVVGKSDDGFPIVTAEVFGTGIDIWLRAQGKLAEVL